MAFAKVHLLPSTVRMEKKEKVGEAGMNIRHSKFNVPARHDGCQGTPPLSLDNDPGSAKMGVGS